MTTTRRTRTRTRTGWCGWLTLTTFIAAMSGMPGCGSDGGGGSSSFDLPTAGSLGGPVLPNPRVQPIYFKGFPYATDIDTFLARLSSSTYWSTVTSEYGVGALVALPGYATNVSVPATVTGDALPALLAAGLAEGAATLGPPRADTVYTLFFDPATTLSVMGLTLCQPGQPSAYHDEWPIGAVQVPVAVIPSCASFPGQPSLSGPSVLTLALSHELVEAATDPFPNSRPAWSGIDRDHILWSIAFSGGELADLCENDLPNLVTPGDIGSPVQRIWSNEGARAGTGPCVPVPAGEVYFNAAADLPSRGDLTTEAKQTFSVPVLQASIGAALSAHVTFHGGPGAPTDLRAVAFEIDDPTSIQNERPTPIMGKLGQSATAPIATSSSTVSGVVPLIIGATSGHGDLHLWVGGVDRR
jgi:hypothetical protein